MNTTDKTYIVYKRDGRYEVCESSFRHMLYTYEIFEEGITSYSEASLIAADKNFEEICKIRK